jgi:uncharacterized membrane protein HdeD (DUF308 family)
VGGLFLHLIGSVLGVLIGFFVVTQPVAGALAWTMLFVSFLTVIGLFRVIAAIASEISRLGMWETLWKECGSSGGPGYDS